MVDGFTDKTILVTGGTGSFGSKFVEMVLPHNPKSVRVFSRGELLQVQMQARLNDERLRFFIGDVRDRSRLTRAMSGVDIVVHAAALKHVPVCEYNPIEAVETNVTGAKNIVEAALDCEVQRVLAIGTDKAVHPTNLYGATKMVMEKLIIQANVYAKKKTLFSCVRYGNVVGSRGSVIPVFKEQASTGQLTITDPRMTRFLITLDQGVCFVMNCIRMMRGGEVFVPKIPTSTILDTAQAIAPDVNITIIGIRPGEKINEVLITEDETRHTVEYEDFYVVKPEFPFWTEDTFFDETGKKLPDGFRFTSDTAKFLTVDEIRTFAGMN